MTETVFPVVNDLSRPFWSAGERNELLLPVCISSGRAFWPPSPISPFVNAGSVEWRRIAPEGVVKSIVIYRRIFQASFERLAPYGVGLIELDAGPRLMAHVPKPQDPDAPRAGCRAMLRFTRLLLNGPAVPTLVRHE